MAGHLGGFAPDPPLLFLLLMLKYRLQFLGGLSGSVSALLFHLICYRGRYARHKMKQNTRETSSG